MDTKPAKPAPGAPALPPPVSQIINLTRKCNHRCIFCSRDSELPLQGPAEISAAISLFKDGLCFEGGEPTLYPDLLKWVRKARAGGVRDIVLVTNGFGLDDPATARRYVRAGVNLFNFNLPAHNEGAFDALTQTRGNFPRRVKAVKEIIKATGGAGARITLVLTSVIAPHLADYARFVMKEFPGLYYLEINFPKRTGCCAKRPWLVPRLSEIGKPLREALGLLEKGGMKVIMDGIPLCVIPGFEHFSIDAQIIANDDQKFFFSEKAHCPPCARCSLKGLCLGPRKDYASFGGCRELKPSRRRAASIEAKIDEITGGGPQGAGEKTRRSARSRRSSAGER